MASFFHQLLDTAGKIETVLEQLLPKVGGEQFRVCEAMRYAALGGGKRLRPFLLVETARMFDYDEDGVWLAAAALECVHVYSLIHDDLPCMDNDDFRRGKPTVHKAYDEAIAVLAGDALLTLAFEIMARPAVHKSAAVRLGAMSGLAKASGTSGMIGGQVMDIYAGDNADLHYIKTLQAMKTGALIRFAVEVGARMGGANSADVANLVGFADALGLAFQIRDDILDAEGDAKTMGKRTRKDADLGKATFVSIYGLNTAKEMMHKLGQDAKSNLAAFGPRAGLLIASVDFVLERKK